MDVVADVSLTALGHEVAAAGRTVVPGGELAVVAVGVGLTEDVARAAAAEADKGPNGGAVGHGEEPRGSARAGLVLAAPGSADDGRVHQLAEDDAREAACRQLGVSGRRTTVGAQRVHPFVIAQVLREERVVVHVKA